MACNESALEDQLGISPGVKAAKIAVLAAILLIVVLGNSQLLARGLGKYGKLSATDRLVKTLAITGIASGVVNIGIYMVINIFEFWVLGMVYCQVHGVIGTVLLNGWTWMLVIVAFERYVKLLASTEYNSFFSEVNTKIMTWGMFLLLFVFFLGPVYGWGEYSCFRGVLDITIAVHVEDSAPTMNASSGTNAAIKYYQFFSTHGDNPAATDLLQNISVYFEQERSLVFRKPLVDVSGITLPARIFHRRGLDCLWLDYEAGRLQEDLNDILWNNDSNYMIGNPDAIFRTQIAPEQYLSYRDLSMSYQEGSTCSLDYSPVNNNVHSFIGFSLIVNMLLPMALTLFFYSRLFYAGLQSLCMFNVDGAAPEDAIITRVFAYTTVLTFACNVPYFAVNLASGHGHYVSSQVHFAANCIMFFSPCLLFWFYIFTIGRTGRTCDSSCWFACCDCDKNTSGMKRHSFGDGVQNGHRQCQKPLLVHPLPRCYVTDQNCTRTSIPDDETML